MKEMSLTIHQAGIEAALTAYVNNMGVQTEGKTVTVTFTAGRKSNGYSAEVTISASGPENSKAPNDKVIEEPIGKPTKAAKVALVETPVEEVAEPEEVQEVELDDEESEEEEAPTKPTGNKKSLFAN